MKILLVLVLLAGCTHPAAQPGGQPAVYPVSDPCRALSIAEDAAFTAMQKDTNGDSIAAYTRAGEAFNDCIAATH